MPNVPQNWQNMKMMLDSMYRGVKQQAISEEKDLMLYRVGQRLRWIYDFFDSQEIGYELVESPNLLDDLDATIKITIKEEVEQINCQQFQQTSKKDTEKCHNLLRTLMNSPGTISQAVINDRRVQAECDERRMKANMKAERNESYMDAFRDFL